MIRSVCALVVSLSILPADSSDDPVVDWIKSAAVPLKSTQAGNGFDDMRPIKALVGPARIVALGETTHGTREVFQMKHRMLEFLVREMGFTVFGIEASMPDCAAINEYVLNGKGDPEKAVAGQGFWTWSTEEVLELVKWMRAYNEDPANASKPKLKFYGFDMQHLPSPVNAVSLYLQRVDADAAGRMKPRLQIAFDKQPMLQGASDKQVRDLSAAIDELGVLLDRNREPLETATSKEDFAFARRQAVVARQAMELVGEMRSRSGPLAVLRDLVERNSVENVRDRCMAENVGWILENEGAGTKIVLWAHNWHVSVADPKPGEGMLTMGSYLEREFKDDYLPIGFSFNQGSFQAIPAPHTKQIGLREWTVGPAKEDSIDATFAKAGIPIFILDLRNPPAGAVAAWLNTPHPMRLAGAVFDPAGETTAYYTPTRLAGTYEAMIFIDNTTRARPLHTSPFSSMDPASVALASKPRLGVRLRRPDDGEGGLIIEEVLKGQSAEAAGLKAGDRILKIADQSVSALVDLRSAMAKYDEGDWVGVTIQRDGQTQVVEVKLTGSSSNQR